MTETYSNGIMTLNVTLPTVDQTYDGTSPNAQSGTAIEGKLANYTPTASLATVATTGAYSDLSGTPTVDQTYNSASTNAQSGTAIAGALAGKEDAFTVGSGLEMDTSGSTPVLQVSFTQQQLDYLKRALGVDETVLWTGDTGAIIDSTNGSITLSETAMNFEKIRLYAQGSALNSGGSTIDVTIGSTDPLSFMPVSLTYTNDGSSMFTDCCVVQFNGTSFAYKSGFRIVVSSAPALSRQSNRGLKIIKVVGINRIAGGN
jgi:hypothetical protein